MEVAEGRAVCTFSPENFRSNSVRFRATAKAKIQTIHVFIAKSEKRLETLFIFRRACSGLQNTVEPRISRISL